MESNKFTQQKIEDTLNSLDGISRAEMPSFFYTRLQARLAPSSDASQSFWLVISRPAVSLVTLSILALLNIAAINYVVKNNQQKTTETNTGIQSFANEYNLTVSSMYNENENK